MFFLWFDHINQIYSNTMMMMVKKIDSKNHAFDDEYDVRSYKHNGKTMTDWLTVDVTVNVNVNIIGKQSITEI